MILSLIELILDFECILRLDNRQPVQCNQYDCMKNVNGNKKLVIGPQLPEPMQAKLFWELKTVWLSAY